MSVTKFILAGNFIDGSGSAARRNIFLGVQEGIINYIGPSANLPLVDKSLIYDFTHCTILPALVDCSVSLFRSPSVDSKVRLLSEESGFEEKASLLERHIHDCHSHGVLGIANNYDTTDLLDRYRERIDYGRIIDIRTSGPIFTQSREDFAVGNNSGGDFLKLVYSGNVEDEKRPHSKLKYEELCHFLQHREGIKAVVVANGPQQVSEALEAGCDAIEQGYLMGEGNLRKMADKNVLWIPSLLRAKNALDGACTGGDVCCRFSLRYLAPGKQDPGAEAFWKKMLSEQLAQLSFARKLGVKTAVGTGAGSIGIIHGESMVEEMKLFIKAGYSLEETIRCASDSGARFFGMEKLGTLNVGRKATFLISRGTVKQLPRKLSYLEGIYVDGAPSKVYSKNPVVKTPQ